MFVVPPIDERHFPPVLSMAMSCAVNGDTTLQRIDIGNDPLRRVQIEVFGKDIAMKAPHLYARIKDKIDPKAYKDLRFLFLRIRNISDTAVREIELVYGLWEKDDLETRVERHFKAEIAD